ncbi:MAG TPA: DMT family transporter, partial [Dehalococcoidia bacterium]
MLASALHPPTNRAGAISAHTPTYNATGPPIRALHLRVDTTMTDITDTRPRAQTTDLAILALGVAAVSTAAVLIREAAAPALVIAAYRLALASLPLLGVATLRRERLLPPAGRQRLLTLLSGAFLAAHFGFWIASVQETSIITSVVLVTAQPLFVVLASGPLLGEKPTAYAWAGMAFAATGAVVMVADDIGGGSGALRGDLFAVLGAVFAAAY